MVKTINKFQKGKKPFGLVLNGMNAELSTQSLVKEWLNWQVIFANL
jgi:hypothetical protein